MWLRCDLTAVVTINCCCTENISGKILQILFFHVLLKKTKAISTVPIESLHTPSFFHILLLHYYVELL